MAKFAIVQLKITNKSKYEKKNYICYYCSNFFNGKFGCSTTKRKFSVIAWN